MPTLAFDTSSAISVAVLSGDAILAHDSVFAPRGHAELLAPMIKDVLQKAGAVNGEGIESVVVGTGPAPFTGLRVGLVTARTLALAWGIPAVGVCSLDAMGAAHGGAVTVVADARRHEVYWARYEGGERVEGPEVSLPGDIPATPGAVIGRGAALYPEVFGDPPPESAWHPDPAWLARVAARRVADGARESGAPELGVEPLYLRRPDVHGAATP
jgi:tRNA threonylcarbamoyl adenosine modification protein YeaZ